MQRTTIMLPPALKTRAERQAKKLGMSMGEYIRLSLERSLRAEPSRPAETMFDLLVYEGQCPSDVSSHVDDYLYGDRR